MIQKDILYKVSGSIGVLMDISTPDGALSDVPCVVYIHGGGWSTGSKNSCDRLIRPLRERILKSGFAFVSVGYRHSANGVKYPKPITDCSDAVRYIMLHGQEHGIDGNKIMLLGESEGGHLALMCALTGNVFFEQTPDRKTLTMAPLGCVAVCPVTSVSSMYSDSALRAFMGDRLDDEEACSEGFPQSYVEAGTAGRIPTLVLQGTKDETVSPESTEKFVKCGIENGYDFRLIKSEGATHCFTDYSREQPAAPSWSECCDEIMSFITEKLS